MRQKAGEEPGNEAMPQVHVYTDTTISAGAGFSTPRHNASETNITVGQRTKSERKRHVTDHAVSQSDKMASRKCPAAQASEPPLFPSASISCVVAQHRKQGYISSRRSRSGRSSCSSRGTWPRAELRSARPDVDVAKVQQKQTGPRPRGSSVISTCREYKSKLISMNSICRYLRIPATCVWSDDVSRTSSLCKQGAGHELRFHCTLAQHVHVHVYSYHKPVNHRIHALASTSSEWWAINGKLVSDHVRSRPDHFPEVIFVSVHPLALVTSLT